MVFEPLKRRIVCGVQCYNPVMDTKMERGKGIGIRQRIFDPAAIPKTRIKMKTMLPEIVRMELREFILALHYEYFLSKLFIC